MGRPDDDPAAARFSPAPLTPRKRGVKVWIASIVLVIFGIFGLLVAALLLAEANSDVDHGRDVSTALYALIYVQFALSTAQVVSGVAVWLGKRWAIGLATAVLAVNILGNIMSFFAGAFVPAAVGLLVNGSLIATVRGDDVVEWCRVP